MPELHLLALARRLQNSGWKFEPPRQGQSELVVHLAKNGSKGREGTIKDKLTEHGDEIVRALKGSGTRRIHLRIDNDYGQGDVDDHGQWKVPTRGFKIRFI